MVIAMASYALQTPPRVAHAKPPGPIVGMGWVVVKTIQLNRLDRYCLAWLSIFKNECACKDKIQFVLKTL